jgi:hypothetical protein
LGSDGIAAGATPSLSLFESLLQPVESITSPSSISPSHFQFPFRFIPHLIHHLLAALLFGSGLGIRAAIALRYFQPVIGQFAPRSVGVSLGTADAQLLAGSRQEQRQRPPAPGRHQLKPGHPTTSSNAWAYSASQVCR